MGSNKSRRMIGAGLESLGGSLMDIYETRQRDKRSSNRQKAIDAREKRRLAREEAEYTRRREDKATDTAEQRAYTEGQTAKKPKKTPSPWELYLEAEQPNIDSGEKTKKQVVKEYRSSEKKVPDAIEKEIKQERLRKLKEPKEKKKEKKEKPAETVGQIRKRLLATEIPPTQEEVQEYNDALAPSGYALKQHKNKTWHVAPVGNTTTSVPPAAMESKSVPTQTRGKSSTTVSAPPSYESPEDVKRAVLNGALSKGAGMKILIDQFGYDR